MQSAKERQFRIGAQSYTAPDVAVLRVWIREGRVPRGVFVRDTDRNTWTPIEEASEFSDLFAPVHFRVGGGSYTAPDLTTMRAWITVGRVPRGSFVWNPAEQSWRLIEDASEFREFYHTKQSDGVAAYASHTEIAHPPRSGPASPLAHKGDCASP